ncbi:MAG: clostripain-related cysteine peptidase [candidate division WOR-3 bacterium]
MKLSKFLLLIVMVMGFLSLTCHKTKKATWTILAYMDGNNNLDVSLNGNSYCIADAQEMEKIGSTDKVQIMVMLGSLKTGGNCKYYHIEKFENEMPDSLSSTVIENLGTKDMSDKTTLHNFIKAGKEKYPAEHYMLIIDDHGGGWRGACSDEQNGAGDLMSMPDMKQALDTFHFDVIVFHACLMSMVEVAYELKDNADYMVACQFTMPMQSILGSEQWLGHLSANPNTTPLEISKKIVEAVYATANNKQKQAHMAVTDLSKMTALASRISNLGNMLVTETGNNWNEVLDAFNSTHYTQWDDPAFCDLREFCKKVLQEPNLQNINLIKNAAQEVIDGINDAVPMTMTNVTGLTRGGLNIHFPYRAELFESTKYVQCQFRSTNWHAFLSKFISSTGGGGGGGNTGTLVVNSTPTGATVWINGTNTGHTTNVTFTINPGNYEVKLTLSGYYDWIDTVTVNAGQTTTINATLQQQGGGQNLTVSGVVTWPGHSLSNYCIAFLDTSHTNTIIPVGIVSVNPATGAYTIIYSLSAPLEAYVEAFDDVNNNGYSDPGEGLGYWDANGNGQWDDMLTFQPGQTVNNANIVLFTLSKEQGGKDWKSQIKSIRLTGHQSK